MSERLHIDVAVIGSGSLGLWTAYELTQSGKRVAVLEKGSTLAAGSSTRNVRTLRSGAHDLAGISDHTTSLKEARRARAGFNRISRFAPQAFLDSTDTYAPFYDDTTKDEILDRWDSEALPYRGVSLKEYRGQNPDVSTDDVIFAATLPDRCIDSRAVYEKLQHRIIQNGGIILTNAQLIDGDPNQKLSIVRVGDNEYRLEAEAYVVAAGFGAGEVYATMAADKAATLPLRYGRAYVLGTPRVSRHTILPIGSDRPDVSSYADVSLFVDGRMTTEVETPNFEVPLERELELIQAAEDLVPGSADRPGNVHACITLNVSGIPGILPDGSRAQYGRYTFAWPGKMTNAPVVARDIAESLKNMRLSNPSSGERFSYQQDAPVAEYPTTSALKGLAANKEPISI